MIIPIRCFTCGKTIADKYDFYVMKVAQREQDIKKNKIKDDDKTKDEKEDDKRHFDSVQTGDILDSLGLTRYCCRRHMLTTVDMMGVI